MSGDYRDDGGGPSGESFLDAPGNEVNPKTTVQLEDDLDYSSESEISTDSEEEGEEVLEELDLGATILKEIREEAYVCLVCTCEVGAHDALWSCEECYRVYHVPCISSWSVKGSSTDDKGSWKCPACHTTHSKQKIQYKCWCSKTVNPPVNELNPGSCGQSCGAALEGCPHKCPLPCHPGPHAVCNALGPIMRCRCGNHDRQWPCVLTPYAHGWQCEDVCPEFMPCEVHKCAKQCHDGLCGKCEEFLESMCYCGKTKDLVKCHLMNPKKSFAAKKEDNWIGAFSCSLVSKVHYDCKIHSAEVSCQPVSKVSVHCPLSPDVIKTCHCGQTAIDEKIRQSCTDPIPTCNLICNKVLSCGHRCKWLCHEGECSPCLETIKTRCQCGFNSFIVPCKFLQDGYHAECTRKCTALLSCRRHRCNRICCPDENTALARERTRKKGLRNNTVNSRAANEAFGVEASHVCLQTCNKKLSCGNPDHTCHRTCHTGPCPPCLESSNDDLVCHCGKTVVPAPVRCGTKLPPCSNQCVRELACGHPQMPHTCHPDDIPCLKCTKTVKKRCNCGKNELNAMCYQEEVFCAERCGKLLPCQHKCLMGCHKDECICKSICGKKKKFCSHVDKRPCHFPSRCDDSRSCKEPVTITCKCGRMKKVVPCFASADTPGAADTKLSCDTSCVVKEREERLKEAFGVSSQIQTTSQLADIPYIINCLKTANVQQRWCLSIESVVRDFMNSMKQTFHFQPMRREQRQFIHELTDAYDLYSESQDPEPHRSVFISKRQTSSIPSMSLREALDIYQKSSKEKAKGNGAPPPPQIHSEPEFNSILIENLVIGVTRLDIEDIIKPLLQARELSAFVKWISGDTYLLIFEAFMRLSTRVENEVKSLSSVLKRELKEKYLANTVKLVKIDQDYKILEVFGENEDNFVAFDASSSTKPLTSVDTGVNSLSVSGHNSEAMQSSDSLETPTSSSSSLDAN